MKKKLALLVIVFLFFTGCSKEVVKSEVTIDKVTWTESGVYKDYKKMGLMIKNSSDEYVDITIKAECYAENGNYLDNRSATIYAIAPAQEYFMNVSLDSDITDISYDYECKSSIYDAINLSDIKTSFETKDGTGVLTVKNSSDIDTKECECNVVFYNESGDIVGVTNVSVNNGYIPKGKMVEEEIDYPIIYDSVKIYTNVYGK